MAKSEEMFSRDANSIGDVMKLRFYPLTAVKGNGSTLYDVNGKEYIDFNAGWAVANTGYCHPKILKAVHRQMKKLSFSSLTSTLCAESIMLAEALKKVTPGDFDKKVWFGQGSYAMSGHPAQSKFIGGGNVIKLPYPYCYRCPFEKEPGNCELFCLKFIKNYLFKDVYQTDQIAAVVIEAIQSDGGDIVPPKGFLQGLQALCNEKGIYFVLDEVKVGYGRTGAMFGFEHWGVIPDAVIMGKPMASGQPLSAVVGRKELMDAGTGLHLFTTAGNPVACAAGLETLSIIKDEKLSENARITGEYLLEQFNQLKAKYEVIGDVRGKGLIIGMELVSYELGLLYYYTGIHSNVLELTPPLVLTMDQAKKAVAIIDRSMEEVLDGKVSKDKIKDFAGWCC